MLQNLLSAAYVIGGLRVINPNVKVNLIVYIQNHTHRYSLLCLCACYSNGISHISS